MLAVGALAGPLLAQDNLSWPTRDRALDESTINNCFEQWLWDAGSRTQIGRVQALETRAVITVPGNTSVKLVLHAWQAADGRYCIEVKWPDGGVMRFGYDGKLGWEERTGLGRGLMKSGARGDIMLLDDLPVEAGQADASSDHHLLPDASGPDGRACQVVDLRVPDGARERWYFGQDNGRLYAVARRLVASPGVAVLVRTNFQDVQNPTVTNLARSLRLPFTLTRIEQGATMVINKESVEVRPAPDDALFRPPAGLAAEVEETDRILGRYLAACGGAVALEHIKTRITKCETVVTTNGLKLQTTLYQKAPNLISSVQEVPGVGTQREGFDGREGWAESEVQGARKLQGAELIQLLAEADLAAAAHLGARCPLRQLLPDQVNGTSRVHVLRLATLQASAGTLYFDAVTGQLLRTDTVIGVGPRGQLTVEAKFSDFRTVDGVTLPFVTTVINPAVQSITTIQSVQDNVPVDDDVFKQPSGQ